MDLDKREELISDILKSLVQKDLPCLRVEWRKFEDITSYSDRCQLYIYQQCIGEMGLQPILEFLFKYIDCPITNDGQPVLVWACFIFGNYMTQSMPVLQRLWLMKDTVCPLLTKMLIHDDHVIRHSGLVACCQLVMSATQEQMLEATQLGIVDFNLLMNSLRQSDIQHISVLTFKSLFNYILRIYLHLTVRGGKQVREYLWRTRILELVEDLHDKKNFGYMRTSPKSHVEDDCKQLIDGIFRGLKSLDTEPENSFSQYPPELLIVQWPDRQDYPVTCSYPLCGKTELITKLKKVSSFLPCDKCKLASYCSEECLHWESSHNKWCYRLRSAEEIKPCVLPLEHENDELPIELSL